MQDVSPAGSMQCSGIRERQCPNDVPDSGLPPHAGEVLSTVNEIESARFPCNTGGCFPAGTRVWTKDGQVPIEQIRVGDLVLSQPEAGGEQAFRHVVKTFVHEDKTLRSIAYELEDGSRFVLAATGNHPFWAVEEDPFDEDDDGVLKRRALGWTQAAALERFNHLIQLHDGSYARVVENLPVYRTEVAGHGWSASSEGRRVGFVWNYQAGSLVANGIPENQDITWGDDPLLKVRVYDFEVEDCHTCYVGNGGLWVHDTD